MLVIVGSKNNAKVEAVKEILAEYESFRDAEVVSHQVSSGISEQPFSLEETVRGATNRAKNAFKDCNYSFGLESGFMSVPHTKTGYMDVSVCSIYDGSQFHIGLSPAFEPPKEVFRVMREEGVDMSEATRRVGLTEHPKVGVAEGIIGILTKGRMMRKDQTKQAIIMALIHLENPLLF